MRSPLPGSAPHAVAAPAPGAGPGFWSGSSTAALEPDGSFAIAYRVRNGHEGNALNVIARSQDGVSLTTVAELDESHFGAMSIERPALVRTGDGRWRMYVCLATPGTKHWWIGAVEADDLEGLAGADVRTAFPGDEAIGVKDPVIWREADGGWHGLICCHLLDIPDHEDRMDTRYATSPDGLEWTWRGTVLAGTPGAWDARGARLTARLPGGHVAYDGRATAEENWYERTGLARRDGDGFTALPGDPIADVRYLDVVALPDGAYRIFYEFRLPDDSHELRTELIA